jgi:hypothetical protein
MYRYKRKENVRILHGMVYKKTWSFYCGWDAWEFDFHDRAGLLGPVASATYMCRYI